VLTQGEAVAASLKDYLARHPQMEAKCTKGSTTAFYTTESVEKFREQASRFLNCPVRASKITLK
jgi:glutamate racemase